MDFALMFIGLILIGHQLIFFLGILRLKKLMTFGNILQGSIPTLTILAAMFLQSWELMIIAFLFERIWIMFELGIKFFSIKKPLDPFFLLQLLGFLAGLAIVITHLNWIFIWVYGAFWLGTFIHWKKKVQHISN